MELTEQLKNVAVVGAAGKMGSGIATLVANEMAYQKIRKPDEVFRLHLIDISEEAIDGLQKYLKGQLVKLAEKSIVQIRKEFESRKDLVENWEMIETFVQTAMDNIRFSTDLSQIKDANLIFEAIFENQDIKIKVLTEIKEQCKDDALYFSNTSSIPIGFLDEKVGLNGRIIGYHFYNPPVIQKLLEIITSDATTAEAREIGNELGKRLRKKIIPSNDIAGFIGNGHFSRDGLYAISEIERLSETYTLPEAIYAMNTVSQNFMIRPMGIFQLIDYVGIDVFQSILKVMSQHQNDPQLKSDLVNLLIEKGIRGGQRADGSQKDGFLKYEKGKPAGIIDPETGKYVDLEPIQSKMDQELGDVPEGWSPWKKLMAVRDREALLETYFGNMKQGTQLGARLAVNFMKRTRAIGTDLVKTGVAHSDDDVNAVLMNGFYWLYGPINQYI